MCNKYLTQLCLQILKNLFVDFPQNPQNILEYEFHTIFQKPKLSKSIIYFV